MVWSYVGIALSATHQDAAKMALPLDSISDAQAVMTGRGPAVLGERAWPRTDVSLPRCWSSSQHRAETHQGGRIVVHSISAIDRQGAATTDSYSDASGSSTPEPKTCTSSSGASCATSPDSSRRQSSASTVSCESTCSSASWRCTPRMSCDSSYCHGQSAGGMHGCISESDVCSTFVATKTAATTTPPHPTTFPATRPTPIRPTPASPMPYPAAPVTGTIMSSNGNQAVPAGTGDLSSRDAQPIFEVSDEEWKLARVVGQLNAENAELKRRVVAIHERLLAQHMPGGLHPTEEESRLRGEVQELRLQLASLERQLVRREAKAAKRQAKIAALERQVADASASARRRSADTHTLEEALDTAQFVAYEAQSKLQWEQQQYAAVMAAHQHADQLASLEARLHAEQLAKNQAVVREEAALERCRGLAALAGSMARACRQERFRAEFNVGRRAVRHQAQVRRRVQHEAELAELRAACTVVTTRGYRTTTTTSTSADLAPRQPPTPPRAGPGTGGLRPQSGMTSSAKPVMRTTAAVQGPPSQCQLQEQRRDESAPQCRPGLVTTRVAQLEAAAGPQPPAVLRKPAAARPRWV